MGGYDAHWFMSDGWPSLHASICTVELHMKAAVLQRNNFKGPVVYVIYSNMRTDGLLRQMLRTIPGLQAADRLRIVNLDTDPSDAALMRKFADLPLDADNLASLRRRLADTVHLPSGSPRLLLGTDISFLREPRELLHKASVLKKNQALYMADDLAWGGQHYRLSAYTGPQCPGLLGDFIYLSPGTPLDAEAFTKIVEWYVKQPIIPERTTPPCEYCAQASHGLHALDQFSMALYLAEWVDPPGEHGCFHLTSKRYSTHRDRIKTPVVAKYLEAVHDKVVRRDTCKHLKRRR